MERYIVDCGINWGQAYEVEATSEAEAMDKAKKLFLADYALENNPLTGLLGVDMYCEPAEDEED